MVPAIEGILTAWLLWLGGSRRVPKASKFFHHHVPYDDLRVLRDLHVCDGEMDSDVRHRLGFATIETDDGVTLELEFASELQGLQNVGRVTASRQSDEHVTRRGEGFELSREEVLVAEVVSQAGEHRCICAERVCPYSRAAPAGNRINQVIRNMRRIRRASSIPAQEDAAPLDPNVVKILGEPLNRRPVKPEESGSEELRVSGK